MTLNFSQFTDNWPESRKDQFSYNALKAIFEYLEEYEESTGEKVEFDPIAICCDYSEYKSAVEAMQEYSDDAGVVDLPEGSDLVEIEAEAQRVALEWLQERTTVIEFTGGIVIQQF